MSDPIVYGPFISRKQAKEQGLKHYFTGKPCKREHTDNRYVRDGVCMECSRARHKTEAGITYCRNRYKTKMATDEYFRKQKSLSSCNHYHRVMKHDQERMAKHYARLAVYQREHRKEVNETRRAFNARNPGYGREYVVARRAQIKHSELTAAEQLQVKSIYKLRKALSLQTGTEYHVDHHKPLSKGGLHQPSNLWLIPAEENLRKAASWEPSAA